MDITEHPGWVWALKSRGELAIFPALRTGIPDLRGLLVSRETREQGAYTVAVTGVETRSRRKCSEGVAVPGWAQEIREVSYHTEPASSASGPLHAHAGFSPDR